MEALIGLIIFIVSILCFIVFYWYVPGEERLDQIVPIAQEVPEAVIIENQNINTNMRF